MANSTTTIHSRRAVLAGLGGAAAAVAAQALAKPLPASADGEVMRVGENYFNAESRTYLKNDVNDSDVFVAVGTGRGNSVWGKTARGVGVFGNSDSIGTGVYGKSASHYGVVGETSSTIAEVGGVTGWANRASGTGVYGENRDSRAWGALGRGPVGVYGKSTGNGIAMLAENPSGLGFALDVRGRASLRDISGVATIPGGATSLVVNPGVEIGSATLVLLSPGANLGGRNMWWVANTLGNTFTIRLSAARRSPTKVAWLVLG
jgi:hypothetical protein